MKLRPEYLPLNASEMPPFCHDQLAGNQLGPRPRASEPLTCKRVCLQKKPQTVRKKNLLHFCKDADRTDRIAHR